MQHLKKILTYLFTLWVVSPQVVISYEKVTNHPDINEEALLYSQNFYDAMKELGFVGSSVRQVMNMNQINGRAIKDWFREGGTREDDGLRCRKHFHDPLKPFESAGLNSAGLQSQSSVLWAQDIDNEWSWQEARDDYRLGLTSSIKEEREESLGNCFRALGQIMHLLADSSVPAHVRNDIHVLPFFEGEEGISQIGISTYETWCEFNYKKITRGCDPPDTSIFQLSSDPKLAPITNIWDAYPLTGYRPAGPRGLAEYTNYNFLSLDTVFKDYDHPTNDAIVCTECAAEDGKYDYVCYYQGQTSDGKQINHLAAAGLLRAEIIEKMFEEGRIDLEATLDDNCFKEYADILVPKAVGYSAALLDYFFRGRLEVEFIDEGFKVTNRSQEALDNGSFELYYDNADDNRKNISILSGAEVTALAPDDNKTIAFDTPSDLGVDGSYVLVYKGGLGDETDAIVGKVIPQEEEFYIRLAFNGHPPTQGVKQIRIYYDDNEGGEVYTRTRCDSSGLIGPFTKTQNTSPEDPSKISDPAHVALHYEASNPTRILHALWYEVEEAEADYSVGIGLETFNHQNSGGDQQYLKISSDNPTLHVKRVQFKRESTNIFSFQKTVENIIGTEYPVYNVNMSGLYLIARDLIYCKEWAKSDEGYDCEGCSLVLRPWDGDVSYGQNLRFQIPWDYGYADQSCWECERPDVNICRCFSGNNNIASVTPLSDRTIFILSDQHGNNASYQSVTIVEGKFIERYQILDCDGGDTICEMSMTHETDLCKTTYTMQPTPVSRF